MKRLAIIAAFLAVPFQAIGAEPPPTQTVWTIPGSKTAPLAVGAAVAPFTVTTSDQALAGLTLPGKVCLTNPQQVFGSASSNTSYVNVNWAGGDSTSAYTDQIPPGVGEVCWLVTTTTAPHVSVNGSGSSVVIGVQQ